MGSTVAAVFDSYAREAGTKLLFLRQLIFETALSIDVVGILEETLKWGEPSYLTPKTKSGSTIRLGWKASEPDKYAIYFKCTANLVPAFREKYADIFKFAGNRSIEFDMHDTVPVKELKQCIAMALTYHLNKKLVPADRWKMVETWLV